MGAAKNLLFLSLLIAGAVYAYVSTLGAKKVTDEVGTPAVFQPHDAVLRAEVQGIASALSPSISVEETAGGTTITVDLNGAACNDTLLMQAYQICVSHRLQAHRDSKCQVLQPDVPGCQQP